MAYSSTGWSVVSASKAGNAPSIYSYAENNTKANMTGSGYFDELSDTLKVGDLVMLHDTGTPTFTLSVVMTNTGGVVNLSNGTAVDVTAGS